MTNILDNYTNFVENISLTITLFCFVFREAEGRAQYAEERALSAESELKVAMEKLRVLERATSRPTSAQSKEPSVKPTASGKTGVPSGSSSRASSQHPSHASSGASSSRKK